MFNLCTALLRYCDSSVHTGSLVVNVQSCHNILTRLSLTRVRPGSLQSSQQRTVMVIEKFNPLETRTLRPTQIKSHFNNHLQYRKLFPKFKKCQTVSKNYLETTFLNLFQKLVTSFKLKGKTAESFLQKYL